MGAKKTKLDLSLHYATRVRKQISSAPWVLRVTEHKGKPVPVFVVKERIHLLFEGDEHATGTIRDEVRVFLGSARVHLQIDSVFVPDRGAPPPDPDRSVHRYPASPSRPPPASLLPVDLVREPGLKVLDPDLLPSELLLQLGHGYARPLEDPTLPVEEPAQRQGVWELVGPNALRPAQLKRLGRVQLA